jgi:hypothetical protein
MIVDKMLKFDEMNDKPMTQQLEDLGFDSSNSIKNLGSAFIYLQINTGLLILIGILRVLKKYSTK